MYIPASRSYSIAAVGCNFKCDFCQNHEISQMPRSTLMIMGEDIPCAEIVERAKKSGSKTIAYTYTEPTVYFELAYETAILACKEGLKNVFVTNGFMTVEAIKTIAPYLAAANVDLKSFRDDFYKKAMRGQARAGFEGPDKNEADGNMVGNHHVAYSGFE